MVSYLYIISLIINTSIKYDIDAYIPLTIAKIESNFNQNSVGSIGEIGIFQIRPEFSSIPKDQLKILEKNVEEGIKKLVEYRKKCSFLEEDVWVICYNLGYSGAKKIKYPKLFKYYKKFKQNSDSFKTATFSQYHLQSLMSYLTFQNGKENSSRKELRNSYIYP